MGYPVVQGSATEDESLLEAGIMRAEHVVCAMNRESENIVATLSARHLRPDISIIVRAERLEEIRKLRLAGATRTVALFHLGGIEIATAITRPKVADFLAASTRSESAVVLAELEIEEGSPLCGRTISDCGSSVASHVSFVTLERPGDEPRTPPGGCIKFKAGDHLILAGDPDEIRWMRDSSRAPSSETSEGQLENIRPGVHGMSIDSISAPLPSNAADSEDALADQAESRVEPH
ncbi:MAG: voltage-gated potassium channel [Planctomycetota bacterium]|jgi:voltage-gated potassium channel